MSNAEGAITRAASQLPQEGGGGDEQRKRGNDSFALSDDDSHDDRLDEQDHVILQPYLHAAVANVRFVFC